MIQPEGNPLSDPAFLAWWDRVLSGAPIDADVAAKVVSALAWAAAVKAERERIELRLNSRAEELDAQGDSFAAGELRGIADTL